MKPLEVSGRFWLPATPTKSHWGTLAYEPGNTNRVVLEGALGDIQYGPATDVPDLHGILFDGTPCVLRHAWAQVDVFSGGNGEIYRTHLSAKVLLLGMTPTESSEDRFANLVVTFSHLNEWLGAPLDVTYEKGQDFESGDVKFRPAMLSLELAHVGIDFTLFLFCARNIPIKGSEGELKFTYQYKLYITPNDRQSLEWLLEAAALVRQMLMYIIGSGIFTLELALFPTSSPRSNSIYVYPPVSVPTVVRLEARYFNTKFSEIQPCLPQLAMMWFKYATPLEVTRNAISNLLLIDGIAAEGVFLRVAQTLEHFHGIVFPDSTKYVSKASWRKVLKWLRENIETVWPADSTDDRAKLAKHWVILTERIGNINELSFQSRIEQFCDSLPERHLMALFENPKRLKEELHEFLNRVAATRHFLTHFDEKQRKAAYLTRDIETPTLRCWALLHFVVAQYLGLSDETGRRIARGALRAEFLVGRNVPL